MSAPDERLQHRDHLQRLAEAGVVGEEPAAGRDRVEEPPHPLGLVRLEYLQESTRANHAIVSKLGTHESSS